MRSLMHNQILEVIKELRALRILLESDMPKDSVIDFIDKKLLIPFCQLAKESEDNINQNN